MTNEQKYAEVLKALGEVIAQKDLAISAKDFCIADLKQKLEAAERERDNARAEYEIAAELYANIALTEQNGGAA